MDQPTQPKPGTMRQLLARWAELEPTLCRLSSLKPKDFELLNDPEGRWWTIITEDSLMMIQWAVQQAIIKRRWAFTIKYIPHYRRYIASVGFTYDQEGDRLDETILSAYLKEIEAQDQ